MSASETLTDFASALAAVTGVRVDLRGAASPADGWITFGSPGWWTYAPFGSPLFTVGLNLQALADWGSAVSSLDDVADELSAGTLGLMDVRRLRDAEQTVRLHTDHLSAANGDTRNAALLFGDGDALTSGSAAQEISTVVGGLASGLSGYYDKLSGPPPIASALHDVGEALAAFGRGMAGAYWESALHNSAADGINGIAANMQKYLFGQPVTTQTVAQVLAGYSSSAVGGLPSGMADFSGDLAQAAVWSAASAAVTNRILGELDTLDARAKDLAGTLSDAYQTATERLDGVSGKRAQKRFRRSEKPQAGKPIEGTVNRLSDPLTRSRDSLSTMVQPSRTRMLGQVESMRSPGALAGIVNGGPDGTLQVSKGQPLPGPGDSQGQNIEASGTPTPAGTTTPVSGEMRVRTEALDPMDPKTQVPGERMEGVEPLTPQGQQPVGALSGIVNGGPDGTLQVSQGQPLPGPGDSQGQNIEASGTPTPAGTTTSPV
ncbi:hypothetical protein [Frankia sp. ACN1ag]|uniref:hypothetical protein n=1 Tax=Frankia sp. ACN1ag TaxID=102891 RepID=UPI0006DCB8C8|nr:hypothetical protein [Frankia sp. ACN1ag]KQC35622.1 hypothetical protein UK82_25440 [Frankia sp. ACN1ag]